MKNKKNLIGKKIGMSQIFTNNGIMIPISIIYILPNNIIKIFKKKNFYILKIEIKRKKSNCNQIYEIKTINNSFKIGDELSVSELKIGQYIDIIGKSIGKGFTGVMKKYNFKGLEASHGVSKKHRSQGSTGQCQDPGKVFKGKKMAGQMGNKKNTIKNLKIIDINKKLNILAVKGSIPGKKQQYVYIKKSIKK